MSWRDIKQTFGRAPSLPLSLLLVMLFLGHDVFMAAEAAAPSAIASAVPHESAAHVVGSDSLAAHSQHPDSEHPSNCGVGQSALPRSANDLDQRALGQVMVDLLLSPHAPTAERSHCTVWEEPYWPPGTLRALFQVYRI